MRLLPQLPGECERIDVDVLPPGDFVTRLVKLPVMASAEWDSELVTDFDTQCARLSKAQVMRIAWVPSADKAGLRRDEA